MSQKYYQGLFRCRNPQKYIGDPTNICMRSGWEFRLASYLDQHPAVIQWGSEEFMIPYVKPTDNRVHRYFPDFWAKIKDKEGKIITYLIEVKPYKQSVPPIITPRKRKQTILEEQTTFLVNQAKWNAAKQYCEKRGWKFIVITERELGIAK